MDIYVSQLDVETQQKILDVVSLHLHQSEGMTAEMQKEPLEMALSSRLCDLTEIVDYEEIL